MNASLGGSETVVGVSAFGHDASVAVVRGRKILFAAHSERYTRVKNDSTIAAGLVAEAKSYLGGAKVDRMVFYERPRDRLRRNVFAGQARGAVNYAQNVSGLLWQCYKDDIPLSFVGHHEAHAAAGYFTSGYPDATVVVVDGVGEWETLSVWRAEGRTLRRVHSIEYPHSLGLLYSAFTERAGLKPNEDEYILMGMAAHGEPLYADLIENELVNTTNTPDLVLKRNIHRGLGKWRVDLNDGPTLAASVQTVIERYLSRLMTWVAERFPSKNLVYSGGVALNCVANRMIRDLGVFDNIWILPNPGDAGSSLGAAAALLRHQLEWKGPFLGHDIERQLNPKLVAKELAKGNIVGIANGRAEFGPRALGNRSLLADPRGTDVQARVNRIKRRQLYRPFAPVVLHDHAQKYFDFDGQSPYMQYTARCLAPDAFPAICHVDATSRIQTIDESVHGTHLYLILQEFYRLTHCPILLNTSLNIKGEPLVNTWGDAERFARLHDVAIY
ncbi:carbamoyltransferase N-terminal domain-containing protein [Antrihabitans cavernicola]|uniref:Carbamoyltransferase n=1 Tax=Antrihabitans cavernicola TaxID=2495913 RepID=A0A5A7S4U9_9NOCA|nr:carbamoyltransferase N-terminal domain-containing protein [Spelaeibacter cavernicola]KAA0016080.1 hypothetical protein FOY51_26775 [Spelaeibacter cavernicola]